jgi:flagellar operon protein
MVDQVILPNPLRIDPSRQQPKPAQGSENRRQPIGDSFATVLDQKLPAQGALKFSQHAQDRLKARGISLDETAINKLNTAVDSIARKGGKESLIMMGDSAFVVSVKNRTVVTALDKTQMQGNVFTNIDSAMVF